MSQHLSMSFKLTPSPKSKSKSKKPFRPNRFWTDVIKKGQIGTIKMDCLPELAGKQVVYMGKMGGYDWFKLLEDSKTKQYERGQQFAYLRKWIDF